MNLSERFSNHLKNVLVKAIQLATELKQKEVEPIHLLFMLLKEKGSLAHEILNRAKLKENSVRIYIQRNFMFRNWMNGFI